MAKPAAAEKKDYKKADALILAWERYDAISLALCLKGKRDPDSDSRAWVFFTQGHIDKLNALTRSKENELHGNPLFVSPEDALKGFKPKVFKKDDENAISVLAQQQAKIANTKGTMLYARELQGGN